MEIKFYNTKPKLEFDEKLLGEESPLFLTYEPDFEAMEVLVKKFASKTHVLVVGQGGSVTSFYAIYHALRLKDSKQAHFLWTVDPERIALLKEELNPDNTVVIVISKSGQTLTAFEEVSAFGNFETIAISEEGSPLHKMAEKLSWDFVAHPPVGGRYSGFTEVALLPAALCGIDIRGLLKGGRELHTMYRKNNIAFKAASCLFDLEQQGFVDVLGLVYSSSLAFSANLVMQLAHESYGKNNQGQTFLFSEGPDVQHHTLQRFLGGTKNMIGFFVGLYGSQHNARVTFPPVVHSIAVRDHALFDYQKSTFQDLLSIELAGTLESANSLGLPLVHLELAGIDEPNIGKWLAFWQLFAVYSAVLRQVNPFDQPAVEASKNLAKNKRLAAKGL